MPKRKLLHIIKIAFLIILANFTLVTCQSSQPPDAEILDIERQAPIPYPEGKPPQGGYSKTFPLDEILIYRKLPKYHQPKWLDTFVTNESLPPVEERLPEEPQVLLTSAMSDGPGEYGGVWRDFSAATTEGWNWGAGQSQGWFGINYIVQESLVKSGPMYLRSDKLEPFPNLAMDWEWSADGRELTMRLIRGAKWSDGYPFTSEDVIFTWQDLILDPNVNSWTSRTSWQIDGQNIHLEPKDSFTIKWIFPVAFPLQKLFDMDFLDFSVSPAHILKPHHPRYNRDADYIGFENMLPPSQLPPVVMGPWVPVHYKTDELMVLRRNLFYWKVDERGNQLPYLDEVIFEKGASGIRRTLGTLAGSLDHTNVENPSTFVEATKRMQHPDAHFYIEWGRETLGFSLLLNQSANLGVKTERDAELRKLFRDFRFRRALSQAIDREGIAMAITNGPFLRPWPGGIYPGSPYYDINSVVYYPHAPDTSRSLLAELGFKDMDKNGILNWTKGPLAGQDVVIGLISGDAAEADVAIAEALVALFAEIGIKVNFRTLKGPVMQDKTESGEWEMRVQRMGQEYAVPFTRSRDLVPAARESPTWHREGSQPRVLELFEKELIRIINEFSREVDLDKRKALMSQYNRVYTENIYSVGVIIGYYGLALAKRFKNVPIGAPPFLYQWTWGNVQPDQIWVAQEEQIDQIMPGTIPRYNQK